MKPIITVYTFNRDLLCININTLYVLISRPNKIKLLSSIYLNIVRQYAITNIKQISILGHSNLFNKINLMIFLTLIELENLQNNFLKNNVLNSEDDDQHI